MAGIGVVLGAVSALPVTRWLRSELYATSATDPVTFVVAATVLAGTALLATILPARAVTAIDPARTLQSD